MQYVWVILLFLPSALSRRFRVVVPDAPVFSVSGSDVVLPCSVREIVDQNITVNAVDMNVTWSRSDLKDSLVHLYGNHKDLNTDQIPSYRKRTTMFKEELKNGNVSLKLSNVRISDEGEYRCRVDSKSWENSKTFKLSVEVVGSEPVITVKYESGKFSLLCESKGWRPEPELQWRNSKEVNLTAETETQAVADFFNVKSTITVEKIDSFFCTVTQRHHEKEGRIDAQTLHEHVPNPWKIAGIVFGTGFAAYFVGALISGIVWFCKEKRKREEEINEVKSLLNSDRDGRLLHHNLSPRQWDYVEDALLKSEEELKEFNLGKYDPSDRGVKKLKKVIASSKKALLEHCYLREERCADLASVLKSENSKLIELNLSKNKGLGDSGVENLCDGLKDKNCKLKILRLENCDLTEGSCAVLAEVLKSENSKLIELNLTNNRLQDSGVKKLLKDKDCKLEKLWLESCYLTEESCAVLAEVLKSVNSKLTELHLTQNIGLKDSGVEKLCDGLKDKNCKLQKLWLEFCNLTEGSCADLASVLKSENSKLMELYLTNNTGLEDSGVKKLCDGLKDKNCKLEILRLEYCFLTEESCAYLAEVLKSENCKLIELHLNINRGLEDSGVKKLCVGLKDKNCKLEILRLADCSIKKEGFTALASALKENPSSPLKELDLRDNQITETEQKLFSELKDTLPNLKVKLDKCRITDKGCAALTSALKQNPSSPSELQELLFELNDIFV